MSEMEWLGIFFREAISVLVTLRNFPTCGKSCITSDICESRALVSHWFLCSEDIWVLATCTLSFLLVSDKYRLMSLLWLWRIINDLNSWTNKSHSMGWYQNLVLALNWLLLLLDDFIWVALRDLKRSNRLPLDVSPNTFSDLSLVLHCSIKDIFALIKIKIEFSTHNNVLFVTVFLYLLEKWVLTPVRSLCKEGCSYRLCVWYSSRDRFATRAVHLSARALLSRSVRWS
jgi:hypothetical protein